MPVELKQLINQTIGLTQPKWKNQALSQGKTVEIVVQADESILIAGNEHELRETLTNLIFNAVDAMPGGGTITLAATSEGDTAVLRVTDTGIGMPAAVRKRCLEPFFTTKGEKGTGLGLGMVHGIVRRHSGSLEIQSAEGQGTSISIRFPIYRRTQKPVSQPDLAGGLDRSLKVLLVDDEPSLRNVISSYLEADGHTVVTANDGSEGLVKFYSDWYDLVITDRAMPELNGDALISAIRKKAPKKPIIMLTGFGEMMKAAEEYPAGVDEILGKPVKLDTLRECLLRLFSRPVVTDNDVSSQTIG